MPGELVAFGALFVANEHRTAYGMRYNDVERYRKHCANRTHRLRSTLKLTHGKGKEFKKLPPLQTESIKDGHLQLLLFEAERAWAYSQELIIASLQPSLDSRKARTFRHSATGRFRRAVHWATQLLSHAQSLHGASRLSAENLIQASIYVLILNGRFLRYREEFDDALKQLAVARSLLDVLASNAVTSREQALATVFADEIGPEIRHCAHELGSTKAYDVDGIVADLGPKHRDSLVEGCSQLLKELKEEDSGKERGESRKQLKELLWEGQPVQIRNPELVDALLKVQDAEAKLVGQSKARSSKKSIAAFDSVLSSLSDASDLAKKLADSKASAPSTSGTRDNHFVYSFIVYNLLSRRIQRDLLLVSSILSESASTRKGHANTTTDPRVYPGLVKLLDTTLQSLTQMRTLSIVDDSPDLSTAIDTRVSFTKARRCLYLSRCYAADQIKKYAEAVVLVQHGTIHLREAKTSLGMVGDEIALTFYPLTEENLSELEEMLNKDGHGYKKDWFNYNGGSVSPNAHKTYKKPTFFDIALNYVELDMDSLNERAGKEPTADKPPVVQTEKRKVEADREEQDDKVQASQETAASEIKAGNTRSGLGSLLGGWWGRS